MSERIASTLKINVAILGTRKRKMERRKWMPDEIDFVITKCHKHVVGKSLPGKNECIKILKSSPLLEGRSWQNIKDYVRNYKEKNAGA